MSLLSTSDSGSKFRCIVSVPGKPLASDEVLLTVTQEIVPPVVSVSLQGQTLTLSWPSAATDFVLQSTDTLPNPNWQPVGGVVNNSYTATIGPGDKFFRLKN